MMSAAMNKDDAPLSEADEIAALLPWYVTGRISAADRSRVDAYAAAHPHLQSHIAIAREEADVAFAENLAIEPTHAELDARLAKLRASVGADPRTRLRAAKASVVDTIGGWLASLGPRQLAYAGAAAAIALLVQAASIGALLTAPSGPAYETAAGAATSTTSGSFALVAFQPKAEAGALASFLSENKLAIVEGPKTGGVYRIRLGDASMSAEQVEQAVGILKARGDLVSFASAAPKSE